MLTKAAALQPAAGAFFFFFPSSSQSARRWQPVPGYLPICFRGEDAQSHENRSEKRRLPTSLKRFATSVLHVVITLVRYGFSVLSVLGFSVLPLFSAG